MSNLTLMTTIVAKSTAPPVNNCKPNQPIEDIAPAIGFSKSRPNAIGIKSIPSRTPGSPISRVKAIAILGERLVSAPEKNPYVIVYTMSPAVLWTAAQAKASIPVRVTHTISVLKTPAVSAI
jgi:hypothetical protein